MSKGPSFVTIRSEVISLESKADSLLSKYSSFAQTTSSEATGQEKKLDVQIENVLQRTQDVVEKLRNICNDNNDISTTKLTQLSRHAEILQDHWKNFRNIRSSIQQERNRLNLLFSVKNDIEQQKFLDTNEDEYIQNEARRVDQSHNLVDRLIAQALETRDQFNSQSNLLHSANNRMLQTIQRIPGLNQLIAKINTRRRKNALILSSVITICFLILFFTW
ncbi:hypothetical protein Kpol_388p2 [Vanderwaltozyma polyspora DSM 70294]|uniref:Golgi SNAP receptor complex member 1 n=1 Tax=Vanderwaltozyma polyspora (strain ATCC 22028 / DSM 70294 / BCRC 21397 / CBS 2163 / NBRC 10782 / NRRL Y-8283 / UCD 57-17) TaxID=436907 RepID=A7TRZ1_VANPO|nr:uncharacterized protein Kpol_388p2 [Vanderwaltozyma polyspora DSM 70294]EDO14959.1 hypothetical protein Kpol_388p2 [Vanderwaltozyma polyspora DSM 70294]